MHGLKDPWVSNSMLYCTRVPVGANARWTNTVVPSCSAG